MRHVITRDASPYPAFSLKKLAVSFKARYVNDVHLPRFIARCQIRSDHFCQPNNLYGTATRNPLGITGDSKDFSPSNSWNDSKTAVLRQLPRPRQNWRAERFQSPRWAEDGGASSCTYRGIDATLGRYWRVAWRWANSVLRVGKVSPPKTPRKSGDCPQKVAPPIRATPLTSS